MIFENFDPRSFAHAELALDPYASPREIGAQIARAASANGGRYFEATDWTPPAGYDASPEAVERRIAEGEEIERRFEAASFDADERAGEYGPCDDDGGEW